MNRIKDKNDNIFKLNDVPGDGNCFFHSVALSDLVNISNHSDLREHLAETISHVASNKNEHKEVIELFELTGGNVKLQSWIDKIKTWADQSSALFIAYIYQINVVIISNLEKGFDYFDVKQWSTMHRQKIIPDDCETLYLYHFMFQRPFSPSKLCNHFGYLKKTQLCK